MKTASKVFVILNLCWKIPLFAIYFLAALTLMAGDPVFAGMTGLVGVGLLSGMIALFIVALIFVPGIVFGFIALVRLNRAVCRDDVPTWLGVCTLIFTSLLGGIFMLCVSDRDFEPTATVSRTVYYQTVPVGQPMNGFDPNARNPYQNPNQPMYQNPYRCFRTRHRIRLSIRIKTSTRISPQVRIAARTRTEPRRQTRPGLRRTLILPQTAARMPDTG